MFRTPFRKQLFATFQRSLLRPADYAFVFDIDGVLVRGSKPIPSAKPALELLQKNQVPYLLLTNGGGVTEAERAHFLSQRIGVEISPLQLVQSHTPMRAYTDKWLRVMVVGGPGDKARQCALQYGFKDVVMPHDIVNATPGVSPHHQYGPDFLKKYAIEPAKLQLDRPIDAVLVFNDSRDMGTDLQVILDMLNSQDGRIGTKRTLQEKRPAAPAVPIVFSNNDFLWAADYPLPRFGQGAIRMMVETLYKQVTGSDLESTILGKPFVSQYQYAAATLAEWSGQRQFHQIYMVGDNPASDIQGANRSQWKSLLLRTGVYQDGDSVPSDLTPTEGVFDDVLAAVQHVVGALTRP